MAETDYTGLIERLRERMRWKRSLVDEQEGGDALVLVQRQQFNKEVGQIAEAADALTALVKERDVLCSHGLEDLRRAHAKHAEITARAEAADTSVDELQSHIHSLEAALAEAVSIVQELDRELIAHEIMRPPRVDVWLAQHAGEHKGGDDDKR